MQYLTPSTDLVKDIVSIIGQSKKGIDFYSLDKQPVRKVCLFLVPQGQFQKHLHTLANIAKLLHRADFRQELEEASSEAAIKRLIGSSPNERSEDSKPSAIMLPHQQIELKLQAAVTAVLPEADVSAVLVRPCDPKFGDYQSNALMSLAKTRKLNPRQLATDTCGKTRRLRVVREGGDCRRGLPEFPAEEFGA